MFVKKINLNDTFYNITKDDTSLKDAFIELGFKPMANAQTYQTVGRVITLKKAIEHINMDLKSVEAFLQKKGIEVSFNE